jgi:hypothetical protein
MLLLVLIFMNFFVYKYLYTKYMKMSENYSSNFPNIKYYLDIFFNLPKIQRTRRRGRRNRGGGYSYKNK